MKFRFFLIPLILSSLAPLGRAALPDSRMRSFPTAPRIIYADALAQGWSNWSWAAVDLCAASPVHSGVCSLAVDYGAWEGLYLHYPELSPAGFSHLRFYLHGGSTGGQRVNLYLTLIVNGVEQNGPSIALPQPQANHWLEVQAPLANLGAVGNTITGLVWQGSTNGAQPRLYLDDIALIVPESPDGPSLSEGSLLPRAAPADGSTWLLARVRAADPQGQGDLASVILQANSIGRGAVPLHDDGLSNDGAAGDGLWGAALTVPAGTSPGERTLAVTAADQAGHQASLQLGAFIVLAPPGGDIPPVLPQRIGWGSNAWDEAPGQDWQVNSGVPWDWVYQYITYEWYTDGWGGSFVTRFVGQAWNKGFTPMVVVYMMLAVPPDCGEGGVCYAQKLQNAQTVHNYLAALGEAARQAQGVKPVVFNLEPDFYGFMQQLSNSANRPPGVQPDDPASYPVVLNVPGYPNTLAGFGRRMVDVVHSAAPNALVAPMASMWATNGDPNTATSVETATMGQRTAAFLDAMGGDQADILVVEWSDRDAGSGLRPWWDDTDQAVPRPTRAILWENALSAAAGKRLLLWQVPVGNMSLDNTCNHYQDNRAAYLFHHPRDLFDAGVFGVLFGGGAACMTDVKTDGGFVGAQGGFAYGLPAAPTGLASASLSGPAVTLRWNEGSEPDLWGYRVAYQPAAGGAWQSYNAGRRNFLLLILPYAGSWRITVSAYDAMGQAGPASAPIVVTTTNDAHLLYLPVGRKD